MKSTVSFLIALCLFCTTVLAQSDSSAHGTPGTTTPVAPVAPGVATGVSNPTSPAPEDRDYDKVPVTYNMTNGAFDKVLPFDRPFIFHFTGIPTNVSYIQVIIIKDDLSHFRRPKPGMYTSDSLDLVAVKYISEKWTRPDGAVGTNINECQLRIRWKLLPNTSYSVNIVTGIKSSLSKDQQNELKAKLMENPKVMTMISKIAQTSLNATLSSSKVINQINDDTRKTLSDAVHTVNPNYDITSLGKVKTTLAFQAIVVNFLSIMDALNALHKVSTKSTKYDASSKEVATLQSRFMSPSTNWGKFVKGDTTYLATNKSLDLIKSLFTNAPDSDKIIIDTKIQKIKDSLDKVPDLGKKLSEQYIDAAVIPNTYVYLPQNDTYVDNFVKNAKLYVNLDMGYAYVGRIDRGLAYTGFNIYFRPIDRSIPLSQYGSFWQSMSVRSSLLIGITLGSVAEDNVRKGFIGDQGLVLGYGLKLISFLKFNAGTILCYRYDNNPLLSTNHYHTSLNPFVSFSIDIDARSLFSGIGDSIFK